jgi:glycosyltransferase involved in cell wall biosynthesis
MKILVDLSVFELPATGIAKSVQGLYAALNTANKQISIHGVHRRRLVAEPPAGMQSRRVAPLLPPSVWRRRTFARIAHDIPDTFVHFPWNGKVPQVSPDIQVVTTLHDVLPLLIPGFFASEEEELTYRQERQRDIGRSHVLVTDSEFSRREIIRHFRVLSDPRVIPCATNIGDVPVPRGNGTNPYFLYVGGLDLRKSVDMLLRVFLQLRAEGSLHAKLILTGSERHAPASLTSLLESGKKSGHVEHLGYVREDKLAQLYASAIALVYPSMYEGFGMPPLEAMTLGCPVVTCRATSLPEVCGETAYYIEPFEDRSLAQALTTLEGDLDLRHRLSSAGQERSTMFSWDKSADLFLRILEECSGKRR